MAPDPAIQLIPIVPPVPLMNSLVSTNKVVVDHNLTPTPTGALAPTPLVAAPIALAAAAPPVATVPSLDVEVAQEGQRNSKELDAATTVAAAVQQDEDSPMTGPPLTTTAPAVDPVLSGTAA